MKTSRKTIAIFIALSIIGMISLQGSALARSDADKFCSKLGPISQQMINRMNVAKHGKLQARTIDESKIASIRSTSDAKRESSYQKLYEKYNSQTQKEAIDEYKNTLEQALKIRRAKTDQARIDFVNGVNTLVSEHYQIIDSSESSIISSVQAAADLAANSCADGEDPKIISQTFKQNISFAKNEFKINKSQLQSKKDAIDSLLITRKKLIDEAMSDFKATAEAAKTKLVNSLK